MEILDKQLLYYKSNLEKDVRVDKKFISSICSTMYVELENISKPDLEKIEFVSPILLKNRIDELIAFNMMMDNVDKNLKNYPEIVRAQIIVQNYISFVYLKDSCFEITKRVAPNGSITKKVCKFLLNNPIRAFRNSIAHGNWEYNSDYSGIVFYSRKGEETDSELVKFEVSNIELNFWQALSRATAYTIYTKIIDKKNVNPTKPK